MEVSMMSLKQYMIASEAAGNSSLKESGANEALGGAEVEAALDRPV